MDVNQRTLKKGQTVKTHEIIVIDPVTRKCRRVTPAKPGELFILRFEGVYHEGTSNSVEETQINIGGELAGCPV